MQGETGIPGYCRLSKDRRSFLPDLGKWKNKVRKTSGLKGIQTHDL